MGTPGQLEARNAGGEASLAMTESSRNGGRTCGLNAPPCYDAAQHCPDPRSRPCPPSPRASSLPSPLSIRRHGTPAPIRRAFPRRKPGASGTTPSCRMLSSMRSRCPARSAAARDGPRRTCWSRIRPGASSPPLQPISRATAWASMCSTTPGPTPTSAPAGATIRSCRSPRPSRRRPDGGCSSPRTPPRAPARR